MLLPAELGIGNCGRVIWVGGVRRGPLPQFRDMVMLLLSLSSWSMEEVVVVVMEEEKICALCNSPPLATRISKA